MSGPTTCSPVKARLIPDESKFRHHTRPSKYFSAFHQTMGGVRIPFFRNLLKLRSQCHNSATMSQNSEPALESSSKGLPTLTPRPFRVKLRGSILALIGLPNRRQVRGKLHQLSTTGGLVNVEQPLDEKLQVEFVFHLGETTIREKAEMMFPMWATQGWLQPFRFIGMPEANKSILDTNLRALTHPQQEP